jgi:hypothetical protein
MWIALWQVWLSLARLGSTFFTVSIEDGRMWKKSLPKLDEYLNVCIQFHVYCLSIEKKLCQTGAKMAMLCHANGMAQALLSHQLHWQFWNTFFDWIFIACRRVDGNRVPSTSVPEFKLDCNYHTCFWNLVALMRQIFNTFAIKWLNHALLLLDNRWFI